MVGLFWRPVLLSCSRWDPRKRLCSTHWGKGQDRAPFAVCGLGHSDWLARGLQAQSCFGYWGCNVSMESVQQEKGVGRGGVAWFGWLAACLSGAGRVKGVSRRGGAGQGGASGS